MCIIVPAISHTSPKYISFIFVSSTPRNESYKKNNMQFLKVQSNLCYVEVEDAFRITTQTTSDSE